MEVECPFEKVEDKALEISRILLLNLGARMLRGLKNQTTADEHNALLFCVKILEREQQRRASKSGVEHPHHVNAVSEVESGER